MLYWTVLEWTDLYCTALCTTLHCTAFTIMLRAEQLWWVAAHVGGNLPVIEALIDAGAQVDHIGGCPCNTVTCTMTNVTACWTAAKYGDTDTARLLLEKGANANHSATSEVMSTPLTGRTDTLSGDGEAMNATGFSALLAALQQDRDQLATTIRLLLDHGADPHHVMPSINMDALFASACIPNAECVQILLDRGVSVNKSIHGAALASKQPQWQGATPLCAVCMHPKDGQNFAAAMMLVDAKADVNHQATTGYTPLHLAAQNSIGSDVIQVLLNANAAVDAVIPDTYTALPASAIPPGGCFVAPGYTPLHIAASRNFGQCDLASVELLLSAGANVNRASADGVTPLLTAVHGRVLEMRQLEPGSMISALGVMQALLRARAEVNHVGACPCSDEECYAKPAVTALWIAANAGDTPAVQLLLESKADVNFVANVTADRDMVRTTIDAAREHGHVEIVQLLFDATELLVSEADGHIA